MAKLKAKVAKIEDVPENARDYYTKGDDGAYYLDAEGVDDMPAVIGLRKNRDELRDEKRKLEEKHSAAAKALQDKIDELEKGNKGGKNDEKIAELESRLKQTAAQAQTEKQQLEEKLNKGYEAQRGYIRKAEIAKALAKHGGNPKFLMHILESQVKVDLEGDTFKATVVDANGNAKIKNSMNEAYTIEDLVADMKANNEFAGAFPANPNGGAGGGDKSGGGGGTVTTIKRGDAGAFAKHAQEIADGKVRVVD